MNALIPRSVTVRHARRAALAAYAVLSASALLLPAARRAQAATSAPRTVLVVGDSLSAEYGLARGSGWVNLLAQRLALKGLPYQVVNASVSGETTAGGHTRLPALLQKHRPHIVILELGGNDALRGLDLAASTRHLSAMIDLARHAKAQTLLLGMQVPPNYGKHYSTAFAAMYQTLAKTKKLPLVPFFLQGFADQAAYFQADQIHPNVRAQALMLDEVWPTLLPLLREPPGATRAQGR